MPRRDKSSLICSGQVFRPKGRRLDLFKLKNRKYKLVETCELVIFIGEERRRLSVPVGANLRRTLLEVGISPYTALTRKANCGGRGLCATCGVLIEEGALPPQHWHDKLAARYGYPRLSCQITISGNMTVRLLTDKIIWGKRQPH